ncbi:MAG: LysM peptidoglycan-binding domain-containing protein [Myxococcales bacterium]|nr:LysM peptidoglycan-binding domain-containing protein [Myxococcales bacterium]
MRSRAAITLGALFVLIPSLVEAQSYQQGDESEDTGTAMWMSAMDEAKSKEGSGVSRNGQYEVKEGDTLWGIAESQLGNAYEWPRLWSYNPQITNPHWIYPDTKIRLGPPEGSAAALAAESTAIPTSRKSTLRRSTLRKGDILLGDLAFLDKRALEDAGWIVGSHEEHMLLSPSDWVYVRFNGEPPVAPGTELTIFRNIPPRDREIREQGDLVRIIGTVQLVDYDKEKRIGRAKVIESMDPIERGLRVSAAPRRFTTIAPRVASNNVEGTVIASAWPNVIMGSQQLLFIDKGSEDGVELGTRFFLLRRGDVWRDSKEGRLEFSGTIEPDYEAADREDLPDEVRGEGRVVNVQKNTSTILLTNVTVEVEMGDRVKAIQGR